MCPVATALLSIRSELELLLEQLRQSTTPIQWDELTSAVLHGWLPWPLEDATRQRLTMEELEAPSLSGAHAEMLAAMRAPASRRQPRPHWLPPPPAPWAEIHVWLQGRAVQGTRQASHPARGQWGPLACLAGCSSTRCDFRRPRPKAYLVRHRHCHVLYSLHVFLLHIHCLHCHYRLFQASSSSRQGHQESSTNLARSASKSARSTVSSPVIQSICHLHPVKDSTPRPQTSKLVPRCGRGGGPEPVDRPEPQREPAPHQAHFAHLVPRPVAHAGDIAKPAATPNLSSIHPSSSLVSHFHRSQTPAHSMNPTLLPSA